MAPINSALWDCINLDLADILILFDFACVKHFPLSFWLVSCLHLGDCFIMLCLNPYLNILSSAFRSVFTSLNCLLMLRILCNASAALLYSSLFSSLYVDSYIHTYIHTTGAEVWAALGLTKKN